MKRIFLALTAALALTSCVQDEILDNGKLPSGDGAVTFGTYLGRSAQTKATEVTTETLKTEGFGVNAWYTGQTSFYDGEISEFDVFMNNTRVSHDGTGWTYSPLKYWPNNPGDMVSFVAYAPHMVDADGNTNTHITIDGNNLTYTVANEVKEQVDLLWSDNSETIDMTKQSVDDKVFFYFRHALSKINLRVGALIDMVNDDTTDGTLGEEVLAPETVINVKKVVLMGDEVYSEEEGWLTQDGPFYTGGTLDLVTGEWSGQATGQRFAFTAADHFVNNTEFVLDQNNSNTLNDLLNDESYLMIIPQDLTTGGFKIYIEYDVITEDAALSEGSSVIHNKITSANAITSLNFEQGMQYNINMILGMTTVKVDVEVTDWVPSDTDEDSDNPANFGEGGATLAVLLEKDNILANVNDKGTLSPSVSEPMTRSAQEFSFTSDNESIVTVDDEGNYTAVGVGKTNIYVECAGYESAVCIVEVLPDIESTVTLSTPLTTALIPAANVEWQMGNGSVEDNPTHTVMLTENYYMSQYEITIGQFVEFLNGVELDLITETWDEEVVCWQYADGQTDILFRPALNHMTNDGSSWSVDEEYKDFPVQVSWEAAHLFAKAIGAELPTEAQWEYAARAGSDDLKLNYWWEREVKIPHADWADFEDEDSMNEALAELDQYECLGHFVQYYIEDEFHHEDKSKGLRAVGSSVKPNPWGLYDLHGSVSELCANYFYEYDASGETVVDPAGDNYDADYGSHAVRGSGYTHSYYTCDKDRWDVWLVISGNAYFRDVANDATGFRVIFRQDTDSVNNNCVQQNNN